MSVAVTGRGVVTSLGEGADAFFEDLAAGASGIVEGISRATAFDAEVYMDPRVARRTDRYAQFAVAAAEQAATEASLADCDPDRVAVVIGTGVGGLITLQENCESFLERGERGVSPNFVPMMMPNAAAGAVAIRHGLHGPGFSIASACATGAHAIGEGMRMIERGAADVVVAGGTEAALTSLCIAAFKRMGALSLEGISRPFDARRDGFVMGEGAGVLILEREEHAVARGVTVYGKIAGYGASNDAFDMVQPDEEGAGALIAMRAALEDAGASTTDVGFISAHGTGTPINDRVESLAIRTLFGADAPPISSTKSAIGHLLGAAGSTEALVCVEALRRGVLPPTINYEVPDPECDLDYLVEGAREAPRVKLALSNSFGFGGQNACLAIVAA
ncbi:MAG TPA: beta-ketoacyl-[acyl-carrier-protein] synthase family protein [Solirubrobacteraceae bacterium]|nr:beta-ketoacyl-[acyl-carrier-protein] synthase family protein [Solirubrobacteraceae bacterium]